MYQIIRNDIECDKNGKECAQTKKSYNELTMNSNAEAYIEPS